MAAAEAIDLTLVSDLELIECVGRGDEGAFQILYGRYFPRIYGFVHKRLGNRADTEETVQEIFISVFASLQSYRGDAPFAAWVLGVSRRTIANRFRKKRHPTIPLDGDDDPEQLDLSNSSLQREPTPEEFLECRERLNHLQERLEHQLSPEQQQLFEMHHLRNRSIHDIALAMNKSEDAVKSNLYRARKLLLAQ